VRRQVQIPLRKPKVYFLQHPLTTFGMPGRFSYKARASAIDLDEKVRKSWSGTLYADGFAADTPGSNVDPNVFSEVLPWHLSFCRLSDSETSSIVSGAARRGVLGELVAQGDLIVFGDTFNNRITWVDTVMCVHGRAVIPSEGGQFILEENFTRYWDEVSEFEPQMTWERFTRLRDYRRNLVDTMPPDGRHRTTSVVPHYQVIGRRPKDVAVSRPAIVEQLLAGDGFDFIPLRATDAPLLTKNDEEKNRPACSH